MKINRLDDFARGISTYNDKIIFIDNALPDEEVTIKDIHEYKKYYEALSDSIKEVNPSRIIPKCPYYDKCGGCHTMHFSYNLALEFKKNKVSNILKKYANIDININITQNDKELFYRNKITLKVVNYEWGYYSLKTHNFIKVSKCLIADNAINEILANKEQIKFKNGEIIIRVNTKKEILISIITSDKVEINNDKLNKNIVGIVLNGKTIFQDDYFYETIDNLKFKVSYNSFFQVNTYILSCIYNILRLNVKGINLLDLYCGVGSLGLALKDNFTNIYGIEKIPNAILNAKENAKINDVANAHYYVGDTAEVLKGIDVLFDAIIVDPPRSGLNKETLESIMKIKAQTLIYLSCDPMTLARDLNKLKDIYNIEKIYALDMFPNTYHVECLCVLNKVRR